MKITRQLLLLVFACVSLSLFAQNQANTEELNLLLQEVRAEHEAAVRAQQKADSALAEIKRIEARHAHIDAHSGATQRIDTTYQKSPKMANSEPPKWIHNRLTLGGYAEITAKHCFYSNNYLRYGKTPEKFRNDHYGEFDMPHVVIYLGYDFGHGWSLSSEIEFEHGGTESAIEIEEEEGGEYESEIERGGEVALEQFWIQKSFNQYANLRAGMQVVPVGGLNAHHEPLEYFGVYRPEGEFTIMPSTWHEVALTFWGQTKFGLRYQAMVLPGLDSDRFNRKNWVKPGAGSPYEFKIANTFAGAARIDYTGVKGLRLSLSGYYGDSFRNTLSMSQTEIDNNKDYKDIRGTVTIGSFNLAYNDYNVLLRGSATYGHLSDAGAITKYNIAMRKGSVSSQQWVASDTYAAGIEFGYNFFGLSRKLTEKNQKFYVFARYDIYDSMYKYDGKRDYTYAWCGRQRASVGINYFPIKEIAIKAEYAYGILNKGITKDGSIGKLYNDEPMIAIGITYAGFYKL